MTDRQAIIDTFTQDANDCLAEARILFPEFADARAPEIRWDLKSGCVLGTASHHPDSGASLLRFNVEAASLDIDAYEFVIKHEVAHFVAMVCFRDSSHGPVWKRICWALGGDATRLCGGQFDGLMTAYPKRRIRYYGWRHAYGEVRYYKKQVHERLLKHSLYRAGYNLTSFVEEKLMTKAEYEAHLRAISSLLKAS